MYAAISVVNYSGFTLSFDLSLQVFSGLFFLLFLETLQLLCNPRVKADELILGYSRLQ